MKCYSNKLRGAEAQLRACLEDADCWSTLLQKPYYDW